MPIAPAVRGVDLVSDSTMRTRSAKRMLLDAAEDPSSELRRRVRDGLISLGGRLVDEDTLRGKVDTWVGDALRAVRCVRCGGPGVVGGEAVCVGAKCDVDLARCAATDSASGRVVSSQRWLAGKGFALVDPTTRARDGWLAAVSRWSTCSAGAAASARCRRGEDGFVVPCQVTRPDREGLRRAETEMAAGRLVFVMSRAWRSPLGIRRARLAAHGGQRSVVGDSCVVWLLAAWRVGWWC